MKALFKNQYNTTKSMIAKIKFCRDMGSHYANSDNSEYEKQYNNAWVSLISIFSGITGFSEMEAMSGGFLLGKTCNTSQIEQVFGVYEKALLDAGLIDIEDTMTEDQKMAYYHQQQMEQEYYHQQQMEQY